MLKGGKCVYGVVRNRQTGVYPHLLNFDRCIRREAELGYKHIIVDEGQDFGVIDIEAHPEREDEGIQNCEIINKLQEAAGLSVSLI